jgi:hypothetical protein
MSSVRRKTVRELVGRDRGNKGMDTTRQFYETGSRLDVVAGWHVVPQ